MSIEVNMTALFLIMYMCSVKILAIKFGECPLGDSEFQYVLNNLKNSDCLWFLCVQEIINTTDSHVHGELN